jgi:hypothetical protein
MRDLVFITRGSAKRPILVIALDSMLGVKTGRGTPIISGWHPKYNF